MSDDRAWAVKTFVEFVAGAAGRPGLGPRSAATLFGPPGSPTTCRTVAASRPVPEFSPDGEVFAVRRSVTAWNNFDQSRDSGGGTRHCSIIQSKPLKLLAVIPLKAACGSGSAAVDHRNGSTSAATSLREMGARGVPETMEARLRPGFERVLDRETRSRAYGISVR